MQRSRPRKRGWILGVLLTAASPTRRFATHAAVSAESGTGGAAQGARASGRYVQALQQALLRKTSPPWCLPAEAGADCCQLWGCTGPLAVQLTHKSPKSNSSQPAEEEREKRAEADRKEREAEKRRAKKERQKAKKAAAAAAGGTSGPGCAVPLHRLRVLLYSFRVLQLD